MRTETRLRILAIVEERGGRRPVELAEELKITPQALHRHLKRLTSEGRLEIQGRGPLTRYFIAGAPRLDAARLWCCSKSEPRENSEERLCRTRDVFAARQSRMTELARAGLSPGELALFIAVAGEVGNNCYDHNLGQWRDVPGCWFETRATGSWIWLMIADRGQGVRRSLAHAQPGLSDDQTALSAAFEKNISGRAPEKRGNGLKFVRSVIAQGARGLACKSGEGLVQYGELGGDCAGHLSRWPSPLEGTATLCLWSLK